MSEEEREKEFEILAKRMLELLGQDTKKEGLLKTPNRFYKAMKELLSGYEIKPKDVIKDALFRTTNKEMVVIKDINFYSLCEHHILPFFGKISVAYLPNEKVIGLSKIPRIVEIHSKRLQIQEQLSQDIMQEIQEATKAKGVGVYIQARHLCMEMRGIKSINSQTITTSFCGFFLENESLRNEFLEKIK